MVGDGTPLAVTYERNGRGQDAAWGPLTFWPLMTRVVPGRLSNLGGHSFDKGQRIRQGVLVQAARGFAGPGAEQMPTMRAAAGKGAAAGSRSKTAGWLFRPGRIPAPSRSPAPLKNADFLVNSPCGSLSGHPPGWPGARVDQAHGYLLRAICGERPRVVGGSILA